jgi:UDP-3-O-[3-hydroxymyristoyl] glucosamine N-acyltransferase
MHFRQNTKMTDARDPVFFELSAPLSVAALIALTGATLHSSAIALDTEVFSVAPIDRAGPGQVTFLENPSYAPAAEKTEATVCFSSAKFADRFPKTVAVLVSAEPYRAYATIAARLFPTSLRPQSMFGSVGVSHGAVVHPSARLEEGVVVDPGAVIGPNAEIGSGTLISANSVIGPNVRIGRQSTIGAGAHISHALIGNRVIIHQGAAIGQDGFGFAMGSKGHLKVPQLGRVIIQDDVDIGANTAIDRGTTRDTIIGEGTKIDNLVQIGHNVTIGRHCVIVAQCGISGSCTLEDYVVMGGQAGLAGHLTIGMGAQIAASAGVMNDIPRGAKWGGIPAQPLRDLFREVATVRALIAKKGAGSGEAKS